MYSTRGYSEIIVIVNQGVLIKVYNVLLIVLLREIHAK